MLTPEQKSEFNFQPVGFSQPVKVNDTIVVPAAPDLEERTYNGNKFYALATVSYNGAEKLNQSINFLRRANISKQNAETRDFIQKLSKNDADAFSRAIAGTTWKCVDVTESEFNGQKTRQATWNKIG